MRKPSRQAPLALAFLAAPGLAGGSGAAHAAVPGCWGDGSSRPARVEMSCVGLTEPFLLGLRGAMLGQVEAAMRAPGLFNGTNLHFVAEAKAGQGQVGDVNFTFDDGRVAIIWAFLEPAAGQRRIGRFIWNASTPGCSDFPGSAMSRCKGGG